MSNVAVSGATNLQRRLAALYVLLAEVGDDGEEARLAFASIGSRAWQRSLAPQLAIIEAEAITAEASQ